MFKRAVIIVQFQQSCELLCRCGAGDGVAAGSGVEGGGVRSCLCALKLLVTTYFIYSLLQVVIYYHAILFFFYIFSPLLLGSASFFFLFFTLSFVQRETAWRSVTNDMATNGLKKV